MLVALGVACLLAIAIPIARGGDSTPTWQLKSYYSRGFDRSFKADLYQEMPRVPRVLVFGGSRSLRMDPATIKRGTGLTAFNFGLHNGRPEDAWAVTDWVLDTHPDKPPAVIWCLQATTLADVPMHPGLIVDERLSQAFPKALIKAKTRWALRQRKHNVLAGRRYGYDGMLWWNGYDTKRKAGLTLQQSLNSYLDADMLATAGNGKIPGNTRSKAYFVQTIRLLNKNHIRPLIVIMPYQPRGAERLHVRGLGRQAALAAHLPLQVVRAPGLPRAQLPQHQDVRRHGERVLRRRAPQRRRTRAGSSATASRTRPAASGCRSRPLRRRARRRARARAPARRSSRPRGTRRCPKTRAPPPTSWSEAGRARSARPARPGRGAPAAGSGADHLLHVRGPPARPAGTQTPRRPRSPWP